MREGERKREREREVGKKGWIITKDLNSVRLKYETFELFQNSNSISNSIQ